jgi:hypothetical protein
MSVDEMVRKGEAKHINDDRTHVEQLSQESSSQ